MNHINQYLKALCALCFALVLAAGCKTYETTVSSCNTDADCASNGLVCGDLNGVGHICITISERCNNGLKDGGESAIDCGFACRESSPPNLCPSGKTCRDNADCDGTKGLVCNSSGTCSASISGCSSNSNCSGGAQVCYSGSSGNPNFCAACQGSGQGNCDSGRLCQNGTCNFVCTSNSNCSNGQVCNTTTGQCENPQSSCTGGCPQGQSCVSNSCQTVPFGGTPPVNMVVLCWGYPGLNGVTPSTSVSATANTLFICPTGFDGSFTSPVGITIQCYHGFSLSGGQNSGTLTTGANGCQRG